MSNMSQINYRVKSISLICILVLFCLILLLLIGSYFTGLNFLVIIIILILVVLVPAFILIRYSWESKKYCPRCNIPVSIYAEYCRNCGLELIKKCPNCDKFLNPKLNYCRNCGYTFEFLQKVTETPQYVIVEKGDPAPSKPNFCPTCGSSLKNAENLRYCEFCGSKLV